MHEELCIRFSSFITKQTIIEKYLKKNQISNIAINCSKNIW